MWFAIKLICVLFSLSLLVSIVQIAICIYIYLTVPIGFFIRQIHYQIYIMSPWTEVVGITSFIVVFMWLYDEKHSQFRVAIIEKWTGGTCKISKSGERFSSWIN